MECSILTKQKRYDCLPDSVIVDSAQSGDNHAMEYLLYKYRNVVRNKVRHFFVRGADQDDLLQVGMIGLWQSIMDYSPEKCISFLSFAKICIERHVITAIKSATRKKQCLLNEALSLDQCSDSSFDIDINLGDILPSSSEMDPEEQLLRKERMSVISSSLQTMLSDFEWDVLRLHHSGKSYYEIASALECKPKSVDNALGRIRRKLESTNAATVICY